MMRTQLILSTALSLFVSFGLAACSSDPSSDTCRLHPEDCAGGAGALCDEDNDCGFGLNCCTDDNNCGGGMCTQECDKDADCPVDMLCEHDMCFYACDSDRDCAEEMSCEHGKTVCEYD